MKRKPNYWEGSRPTGAKRWQGADSGAELSPSEYGEQLFRMYRRYVKQWNDIELDGRRSLAEHTHRVCGAKVVGSSGRFVLAMDENRETGWILEVSFARGFRQYYPGMSCGLNPLRTEADISRMVLHWRGNGRQAFDDWLMRERTENGTNGEWSEYKT